MDGINSRDLDPLIVISGPTASGKSALALGLAKDVGAEIISLDSVQIYRGMDIGSAKPSTADQALAPHHLIDIRNPDERYDAGAFVRDARHTIKAIRERGKIPMLVGGTTMYLSALLSGLAPAPRADGETKSAVQRLTQSERYRRLSELDPERAGKLHPNDAARVSRALEVALTAEKGISGYYAEQAYPEGGYFPNTLMVTLMPERHVLRERIRRRAEEMVSLGIVEETQAVIQRFGEQAQALGALGYSEAREYLSKKGAMSKADLIEAIAAHTSQFAKRQITYWKNEPRKRGWTVVPSQRGAPLTKAVRGRAIQEVFALPWSDRAISVAVKGFVLTGTATPVVCYVWKGGSVSTGWVRSATV